MTTTRRVAALWLLVAACGGKGALDSAPPSTVDTDTDSDTDTDTDADADADTDADTDADADSDTDTDTATPGPRFVAAPVLTMNPAPTPLVGTLTVTTDVPTTIELAVESDTHSWQIAFDTRATAHELMVLGFHAGEHHEVSITAVDAQGGRTIFGRRLQVDADALPADFPTWQVTRSDPARMEPGVNLTYALGDAGVHDYVVLFDHRGHVVWITVLDQRTGHVVRLDDGSLVVLPDRTQLLQLDMFGQVVRAFHTTDFPGGPLPAGSIPLDTRVLHHDLIALPNGNFAALSVHVRDVDDFPTSESDPYAPRATQSVGFGTVVEFDTAGTVIHEHDLGELLDPHRIGYLSLTGTWWFDFYNEPIRDWGHINSVWHDPRDDSFVVSLRHQDAVVKLDRVTGEVKWILAPDAGWNAALRDKLLTPVGAGFRHTYHQHAVEITPDGLLVAFDNRNYEASAYEPTTPPAAIDSRAVAFAIDEVAGTVSQVWEWDDAPEPNYSAAMGNHDVLPVTGNHLLAWGSIAQPEGGVLTRTIEVQHDPPYDEVFHMEAATRFYRVQRGPLYVDGTTWTPAP